MPDAVKKDPANAPPAENAAAEVDPVWNDPAKKPPDKSTGAAAVAVFIRRDSVLAAAVAVTESKLAVFVTPDAVDPTLPKAKALGAALNAVIAELVDAVWTDPALNPAELNTLAAVEPVSAEAPNKATLVPVAVTNTAVDVGVAVQAVNAVVVDPERPEMAANATLVPVAVSNAAALVGVAEKAVYAVAVVPVNADTAASPPELIAPSVPVVTVVTADPVAVPKAFIP
jgi:hypothetical protein